MYSEQVVLHVCTIWPTQIPILHLNENHQEEKNINVPNETHTDGCVYCTIENQINTKCKIFIHTWYVGTKGNN